MGFGYALYLEWKQPSVQAVQHASFFFEIEEFIFIYLMFVIRQTYYLTIITN